MLDQCTGFRVTLYGIYLPGRGGKRQFYAYTAGACTHVPQGIRGGDSQLCQCGGAHLLFCHRHSAPDKSIVRQAGGAAGRQGFPLDEQYAQRCKGLLCQFPGKAKADGFCRGAKIFAHKGVSSAQPGGGQFGAKGGRGVPAAGEEKHLWMR